MLFGDPHWLPHPICLIGNLIAWLEKVLRKICGSSPEGLLMGGFVLVVSVITIAFGVPYGILRLADTINPWLTFTLETIMFYQIFATKCLQDESMKVYDKLVNGTLEEARIQLSWIVGRDTKELDADEITKATIETVAENTADGIIAPMLFMFLGGAPLAFLYKGINTMDSMVGYKNDKYLYFGRCAAKLDDIANFIPARIAGLFMIVAAYVLGLDYERAYAIYRRDRYNHLSPNSAQTESVVAGALGVQLGGGHYYFGKYVDKKTIGDNIRAVKADDINATNKLMYATATICLAIFTSVKIIELIMVMK